MDEPMDVSMCEDISPSDVTMAEAFTPRKPEPKKSSINITINSNQQVLNSTFENNNRISTDNEILEANTTGNNTSPILLNTTDNSLSLTNDFKTPQTSFSISDNANKDCFKQNDLSLVDNADNRNSSNVLNITIETKDKSSSDNLEVVNAEDNATPNLLNVTYEGNPSNALNNTVEGSPKVLNTTFDGNSLGKALESIMEGLGLPQNLNTTDDSSNNVVNTTFEESTSTKSVNNTAGKSPLPNLNTTLDGKASVQDLNTPFDGKPSVAALNTTFDGKSPIPNLNTTFDGKSPVPALNTTLEGKSPVPNLNTTFNRKLPIPNLNTTFDGKSPVPALNTTFDGKSPIPNLNTTFDVKSPVPALNATFEGKSPVPTLNTTFNGKSPIPNLNTTFDVKSPVPALNATFEGKSPVPTLNTTFVGKSPISTLNKTFDSKSPVSTLSTTSNGKSPLSSSNTMLENIVQDKVETTLECNLNVESKLNISNQRLSNVSDNIFNSTTVLSLGTDEAPSNDLNITMDKPKVESLLDSTFHKDSVEATTSNTGIVDHNNLQPTVQLESKVDASFQKSNEEKCLDLKIESAQINDSKIPLETMAKSNEEVSAANVIDNILNANTVLSVGNDQTPSNDLNITMDKPKVKSLLDSTLLKENVEDTTSSTGIVHQNTLQPVQLEPKDDASVQKSIEEKCLDLKIEGAQINEASKIQLESIEKPKVELLDQTFQLGTMEKPKVESLLDQTFQKDIVDGSKLDKTEPRVESLLDSTFQKEKALDSSVGVPNSLDPTLNISTGSNQLFFNLTDTSRLNNTVISSENVADESKLAGTDLSRKSVLHGDVTFSLLDITVTCNADEGNVIKDKVVESEVLDEILKVECRDDEIDSSEEDKLSKTIESIVEQADKAINESFNSSLTEEAAIKEDRVPLKNLDDNSLEQCKGKKEEVKVVEIVVSDNKSCEDKENQQSDKLFGDPKALIDAKQYDFSIFNSPVRGVKGPRNSILRLFDPLSQPTNKVRESQEPCENTIVEDKESDLLKSLKEALDVSDDHDHEEFVNQLPDTIKTYKVKMDEALEQKMQSEQELNTLKLELNQLQQERTTLELELHQKDEIILKTQGEAQKRENQYKHEIKQLYDKLNNINEQNNNEEVKSLKEENAALLDRESQLSEKLNKLVHKENSFQKIMLDYESTLSHKFTEFEKLKAEHDTAKKHLATLEMSFSDLHTKYERSKDIIAGYKNNEEALTRNLEGANQLAHKNEERYESLKAHAKAQIEKSNKELALMKEKHTVEVNKLSTIIRRLEIKNGSIQQALDQKTKECAALAALCDEMTGAH